MNPIVSLIVSYIMAATTVGLAVLLAQMSKASRAFGPRLWIVLWLAIFAGAFQFSI